MHIREIAELLPGTVRQFKDNSPIIYQGEVPRSGFFLKKGMVKVYNLHPSGSEQIVRFYGPGDFFPLPWLHGKSNTELYYYEAASDCEVVSVTRQDVSDILHKNPTLKDYLFNILLDDQTALSLRILSLEQPRANEKIEYTLYYLMFRYGSQKTEGKYTIDIGLTHITLANMVGLTRETVTTEINKLKRKGIISYQQKIYTVDREKLERAIGEDSFRELFK